MIKLTAIVLTKNEEEMISDCLESLSFCDEIIVIDSGSNDKTVAISKDKKAKIYEDTSGDFAAKRNIGLEKASGEWVLYVDADERLSDKLVSSIKNKVFREENDFSAFRVRRKNFYLGNHAWPKIENMERLFKKDSLKRWNGALHESPEFTGEMGELDGFLHHYTHRTLTQMVEKTNIWSDTEAKLRFDAHHPAMSWWRFPRVMLGAFYNSYVSQGGFRVGTAGLIESIYQSFSAFITYAKLWELQKKQKIS